MFEQLVEFIREIYGTDEFIPLHEPRFLGNEREYLLDTIDSTFVSSVGEYVAAFESAVADYTGASFAIATVNGTAALHTALLLAGVEPGDEVITQSLTFVATCNAIRYCNAEPVFVDVDKDTLGLSADSFAHFLHQQCELHDDGLCRNKSSGAIVRACLPMHSFGFPVDLNEARQLCEEYHIKLVEDAAESLGSFYHGRHTGTLASVAAISFNGNKIVTTGGGGMVLTDSEETAVVAKHLTTTAKMQHRWTYEHDRIGFNYRLPNLNAALGLAQMESLPEVVQSKRQLAARYQAWGNKNGFNLVSESANTSANYWLNTLITDDVEQRDRLLTYTNDNKVMTRPAWTPMHRLPMYAKCQHTELTNTDWLYDRIVSLPSSMPLNG